ncbi:MAG: STAS domain-containing protein [Bacteroidota bacterium]
MKYEVRKTDTAVTLKLKERKLDSSISPELKGEFLLLCKPAVERMVVDMADVEFCDSSGLSALLIADRKMKEHGGSVRLINVHKKVAALLKISMLDRVFEIQEAGSRRKS